MIFLDHEIFKVVNIQRPWKYYRKMARNISVSTNNTTILSRGYIPTANPTSTQAMGIIWLSTNPAFPSLTLGQNTNQILCYSIGASLMEVGIVISDFRSCDKYMTLSILLNNSFRSAVVVIPLYISSASSVHYTTSCKHSLVLLRMGEIIARNMLS